MRRPNVVRAQHRPLRIEPERGQVSKNSSEISLSNEPRHVFQEDDGRSYHAKYGLRRGPHIPVIVLGCSPSGNAEGLTREPSRYQIHSSSKTFGVTRCESAHVAENRRGIQVPTANVRRNDVLAVRVELDVADELVTEEFGSKDSSSTAREKGEFIQHRPLPLSYRSFRPFLPMSGTVRIRPTSHLGVGMRPSIFSWPCCARQPLPRGASSFEGAYPSLPAAPRCAPRPRPEL